MITFFCFAVSGTGSIHTIFLYLMHIFLCKYGALLSYCTNVVTYCGFKLCQCFAATYVIW